MTTDERIESLLNAFGQTISDLPKADGMHHVYDDGHRKMAEKTAYEWHKVIGPYFDMIDSVRMLDSYICHLTDVIDRMETALNTAKMVASCAYCRFEDGDNCDGCIGENFEIDDSVFTEEDDEFTDEDDEK